MELISKMHGPCGHYLSVRQEPNGAWLLTEQCPDGELANTPISSVQEHCARCLFREKRVAVVGPDGKEIGNGSGGTGTKEAPAPAASVPAPAPAPAPAAAVAAPAPPLGFPMPAGFPAPVPAPVDGGLLQPPPMAPPPPPPPPPPVTVQVSQSAPSFPDLSGLPPVPGEPVVPLAGLQPLLANLPVPVVDRAAFMPQDAPAEGLNFPVPQATPSAPKLEAPMAANLEALMPLVTMSPDGSAVELEQGPPVVAGPSGPVAVVSTPAEAAVVFGGMPQPAAVPVQPGVLPLTSVDKRSIIPWMAAMPKGEADVDVEEVCRKFAAGLGLETSGPSYGGISPHTLMDASCWRRALLRHRYGLVQVKKPEYLLFGTLYHAVMALRYTRSDQIDGLLQAIAAAGAPAMAQEVKLIADYQLTRFGREEFDTWCPRAVEHNMLAWLPPQKIRGKKIKVPLATRADLLVGIKKKDEPHPAPGQPHAGGIYAVDWKHTSFMTSDLVYGYGMDFQFNVILSIYTLGRHELLFGPLKGIIVHIVSRKDVVNDDSFNRQILSYRPGYLVKFMSQQLIPSATAFYEKFTDEEALAATGDAIDDHWPQNFHQCKAPFKCPYLDICDKGGDISSVVGYKRDESKIIDPMKWAEQPKETTTFIPTGLRIGRKVYQEEVSEESPEAQSATAASAPAPAEPASGKRAKAPAADTEAALNVIADVYIQILATTTVESLKKERFVLPGHTMDKVAKGLSEAIKEAYKGSIDAAQKITVGFYNCTFKKSGIAWSSSGQRGTATWKQIAEAVCKRSWYKMENVLPKEG